MTPPRTYGFPAFTAAEIDTLGTPRERALLEHLREVQKSNEDLAESLSAAGHLNARIEDKVAELIDAQNKCHQTESAICEALNRIARRQRLPIGVGGSAILCVIRDIDDTIKSLEAQRDARWPAVPMGEGTPAVKVERTSNGIYVAQRIPDAALVFNDHLATGETEQAALASLVEKIGGCSP